MRPMPTESPAPTKDERISVVVPPEIEADFHAVVKTLRTSKGGLGELAVRYVVPKIMKGELVALNGSLVVNPTRKAA